MFFPKDIGGGQGGGAANDLARHCALSWKWERIPVFDRKAELQHLGGKQVHFKLKDYWK